MTKIIIAGGRDFKDYSLLEDICNQYTYGEENLIVFSGMAKGADALGKRWAVDNGHSVKEFFAKWKDLEADPCVIKENAYGKYNAMAGINRNHLMGDEADELIAFWDGESKGTEDMINYMKHLNKQVNIVGY